MRLRLSLLAVGALIVAACGAAEVGGTPTSVPETAADTTTTVTTSAQSQEATTTSVVESTTTTSDREVAPDFTLELGEGGTYTLSEGEKPVFMVFWAEW